MRANKTLILTFSVLALFQSSLVSAQSMNINTNGDIGIGIFDALAPLHVFRSDTTEPFMFLESNESGGTAQDRSMVQMANNGGIRIQFDNPLLATAWRLQAATGNRDRFEITKADTGLIEFWIDDLGNGFFAGDLDVGGNIMTNVMMPSDINIKQNIQSIDPETILQHVSALALSAWEYKSRPGERHIGPMAQDFQAAFELGNGNTSISVVDASGVALASIKALEARNRALQSTVDQLQERLETMELYIRQQAPRTAEPQIKAPAR